MEVTISRNSAFIGPVEGVEVKVFVHGLQPFIKLAIALEAPDFMFYVSHDVTNFLGVLLMVYPPIVKLLIVHQFEDYFNQTRRDLIDHALEIERDHLSVCVSESFFKYADFRLNKFCEGQFFAYKSLIKIMSLTEVITLELGADTELKDLLLPFLTSEIYHIVL